jgi:HSP20 family protein
MSTVGITKKDRASRDLENWSVLPTIFDRDAWGHIVGDFFGDFDKYFGNGQVVPCDVVQIKDNDGNITATEIQYALAGYEKDNVTIEVNADSLNLTVEKTEKTEDTSNKHYLHKGISHRRIEASYSLSGYDRENIGASFENGILKLTLPVIKKNEAKKIEIK